MKKRTTLIGIRYRFTVLLVLVLLTAGCASGSAMAQAEDKLTLSVTGYGQASGTPDLANVQLGVSIVDPDIDLAIQGANSINQRITEAVGAHGVAEDDVRTTNYNIWREEIHDPATGMPTGGSRYHVDISLDVMVRDVQRMGDLIAAGLDAGANNIHGISFMIEDTSALEAEARGEAIADVLDRAEKLVGGLGLRLGKPISIGEGVSGAPGPTYGYGLKGDIGGFGGGGSAVISPGQTTLEMQVTVIYEVLP